MMLIEGRPNWDRGTIDVRTYDLDNLYDKADADTQADSDDKPVRFMFDEWNNIPGRDVVDNPIVVYHGKPCD